MSVHLGLPHLFQFGDASDEIATHDADLEYGLEPDYDNPELYGEEEGVRVLYQQALLERD
jgi:hypothetical protein